MLRIVPPAPPPNLADLLDLFADCEACKAPENRGLCHSERCQRQVLPQLKQAAWQRDVHRGENENQAEAMTETATSLEYQAKAREATGVPRPHGCGRDVIRGNCERCN